MADKSWGCIHPSELDAVGKHKKRLTFLFSIEGQTHRVAQRTGWSFRPSNNPGVVAKRIYLLVLSHHFPRAKKKKNSYQIARFHERMGDG